MLPMFEMIGVVRFPVEGHIDILEFMSDLREGSASG